MISVQNRSQERKKQYYLKEAPDSQAKDLNGDMNITKKRICHCKRALKWIEKEKECEKLRLRSPAKLCPGAGHCGL